MNIYANIFIITPFKFYYYIILYSIWFVTYNMKFINKL